ncbi:MAG: hypothetical protein NVS3B26_05700 [Mycobacteriales bacterium]
MTRSALSAVARVTDEIPAGRLADVPDCGADLADCIADLPGRIAEVLADRGEAGLAEALGLLVTDLSLSSAVLREADHVGPCESAPAHRVEEAAAAPRRVAAPDSTAATVDIWVRAGGRDAGILSVVGARPSQLPALRAVAAVIGLALSHRTTADAVAAVIAAADAEADASADLLHDGPVQALVVAHYAAESAVRGGDPAAAREAVQAALVELRRSLWHLRPRSQSGLAASLGMLSARLVEAGRPPLDSRLDEVLAAALPSPVVSTAYRLVQAVALPTGADPVRVRLGRASGTAVLEIEGGTALSDVDRWLHKARAIGCSLHATDTSACLVMPLPVPAPVLLPTRRGASLPPADAAPAPATASPPATAFPPAPTTRQRPKASP